MDISLTGFRTTLQNRLLDFLWRQWSAIGVAGQSVANEQRVVDPEPLLLVSLTICRYDARLFDEVLDWLAVNSAYLNAQRLKNLLQQFRFQCEPQLGAVATLLGKKSGTALKWKTLASSAAFDTPEPLFFLPDGKPVPVPPGKAPEFTAHGLLRGPVKLRGHSRVFPPLGMATLLLRLRGLIGVNSRCELLCLLGAHDEIHPADIARQTGYFSRLSRAHWWIWPVPAWFKCAAATGRRSIGCCRASSTTCSVLKGERQPGSTGHPFSVRWKCFGLS